MDWNAVVTGVCCLATLMLTATGVVMWWQFRQMVGAQDRNLERISIQHTSIATLEAKFEAFRETRRDDLAAINRRQDEILAKLNELEAMFARQFMRRRESDSERS